MATNDIIVLDRDLAFTIDKTDPTNALTASGWHMVAPNVRRILEDFIASGETAYTMEVVILADTAEVRALKFLEYMTGFAIFRVYSGTGDEIWEGYLVIKDADGKPCSLDGDIYLGVSTVTAAAMLDNYLLYMADLARKAEFAEEVDPQGALAAAMDACNDLVRFPEA
jgi:hypothetical protein